eukprot:6456032-Amphidinium_carterae.1
MSLTTAPKIARLRACCSKNESEVSVASSQENLLAAPAHNFPARRLNFEFCVVAILSLVFPASKA